MGETLLSDPAAAPVDSPPDGGEPVAALPAGVDPEEMARRPSTRRRGGLRRRLRYLQRAREVMLRDLGGLVYEIRRREPGAAEALVDAKVQRLAEVDAELRELEDALGPRGETVLREPGIGGSCPVCGELHPSDARFCARCGTALVPQDLPPTAELPALEPAPASAPVVEPDPASEAPTHEQVEPSNGRPDGAPTGSEAASASATDRT